MDNQESEQSISPSELSPSPTNRYTDELLNAPDNVSLEDLKGVDGGLKLIIAQYKEKCRENRVLQNQIDGLTSQKSIE